MGIVKSLFSGPPKLPQIIPPPPPPEAPKEPKQVDPEVIRARAMRRRIAASAGGSRSNIRNVGSARSLLTQRENTAKTLLGQ